jgi:hypothetical protein
MNDFLCGSLCVSAPRLGGESCCFNRNSLWLKTGGTSAGGQAFIVVPSGVERAAIVLSPFYFYVFPRFVVE